MDRFEIRKLIAESGFMTIREISAYVKRRAPEADMSMVKSEAREIIKEAKQYM